jgi:aspartate/glutamate racemase
MLHAGILGTTSEGAALCFRAFCQEGFEAAVYPDALAAAGITAEIPGPDDRALLHEMIVTELTLDVFTERSRHELIRMTDALRARGCDAVALACTEIPLLVPPGALPLPALDSTRLLARAAFEVAIGQRALPAWRGGPALSARHDAG